MAFMPYSQEGDIKSSGRIIRDIAPR